jgi:hypothetical protein
MGLGDIRIKLSQPVVQPVNSNIPGQDQAVKAQAFPIYKGGVFSYEKPLKVFPGDLTYSGAQTVTLKAGDALPLACVGFRVIDVTGVTKISINGGGLRSIRDMDSVTGAEISSLVLEISSGSITIQSWGTGE